MPRPERFQSNRAREGTEFPRGQLDASPRPPSARGINFSGALAALLVAGLLLAGCHSVPRDPEKGIPLAERFTPGPFNVIGHVVAVDAAAGTVVIDLGDTVLAPSFAGAVMFTRTSALQLTAKLDASPYVAGRMAGARLLAGRPGVGDEVVVPKSTPLSPLPPTNAKPNAQGS